jgi:nucleoside-diphosphate-sugar epimerase
VPGKTLIIGCGYIGLPLALELQGKGHAVSAWVHSQTSADALAVHGFDKIIVGSVGASGVWSQVDRDYDLVIHGASSSRGGEPAYEEVFHQGALRIVEHLPNARKIFVSSTSVYGQISGDVVTEKSPAEPATATGKILRQAEDIFLAAGAIVVRSSGIYGPGRAMLLEKFQRGEAVIEGEGDRWINQIHQRDLVGALLHLIEVGNLGEIYNVCDDTPVMQVVYYAWGAEFLKRPMPPYGPVNTQRKRGLTNKRVSNLKLRGSGWSPIYPSFRTGIPADYSPR